MVKNFDLLEVLHSLDWKNLSDTDRDKFIKACDDLLAVDFNNPAEFRKVATAHAEILGLLDEEAAKKWATPLFFNPNKYDPQEYYNSTAFLDENDYVSFRKIQQEAAAQRVKLGLSAVGDQSILLGVMQNNHEALREYIAQHIAPTIVQTRGWDPKAPSDDNVLTDEILKDIQQDAMASWVLIAIEGAELDALEGLINKDKDDFTAEIQQLPGFPKEHADLIDNTRIWALVEARVLARQKELLVQSAFTEYAQFIEHLSESDVLSKGGLLSADDVNFRANLPDAGAPHSAHKTDLSDENVKTLREMLGERYLKFDVARRAQRDERMGQLFLADSPEVFAAELKKLYPAHAYIDAVVTPKFMAECKAQMKPKMVDNIANEAVLKEPEYTLLREVVSQSDASAKKAIKTIKTSDAYLAAHFPDVDLTDEEEKNKLIKHVSDTVDALFTADNKEALDKIRQVARTRAFERVVSVVTGVPIGSQKALVDAFSNMSVDAQEQLLPKDGNDAEKINQIRYIAYARDPGVLKHYMPGANEDDLDAVLASSEQLDVAKKIQNPGIYKALVGRFPVDLTSEQVDQINQTLAGKDWTSEASYKPMVDEIKVICGIGPEKEAAFYGAFGLSADGTAKKTPGIVAEIYEHNKKYQELFNEYQNPSSTLNKNFLGAMLALPLARGTIPNGLVQFKGLQDRALDSANREFFIDVCVSLGGQLTQSSRQEFKKSLELAMTPAVFNEMQAELLQQACTEFNATDAGKAVDNVQRKILNPIQQFQEKIDKHLTSANFVFDVKEIHIDNLLIREQEKSAKPGQSISEKYKALVKDCDANMNELRHEHARLQGLINALPKNADEIHVEKTKQEVWPKIETLKGGLQAQLDKIDQQLEQYAQIKDRINGPDGILNMIHRVNQKPYWCYNRSEITSGVKTREELKTFAIQETSKPEEDIVVIDQSGPAAIAKFTLEDPLASSQVRYFDIVRKDEHTSDKSKTVTIESRFTYDTSKSVPTTSTDRGIHKANAGRIQVDKFPTYQAGSETDPVLLEKAKVDYAMIVATQMLATMDRPPSKDNPLRLRGKNAEQLQYIWTALVVLGEKTPHMKFSPEAIRVVNDHVFNPKAQLGWGWSNFAKDSLHEKVFKKHEEVVNSAIEASKEQASERLNKKGTPKSEEQMKETSQLYRNTVNTNRDERVNAHGLSAETEAEQKPRPSSHT
ncbi:hypothetical protein ACD661_14775 [Legionella lytica]|uniref:Interaptin n=1 Tax=Legionella lytica TaxID=96232 RepID=A0ABW8DAU0_9GAMM